MAKTKSNKGSKTKELFHIKKSDQYRTVDELMERGKPNEIYYALLVLSSFIVAAGLLLGNAAIVIGGMLVTPVLTPVILISLGVSVGNPSYIKKVSIFVGKSFLIVIIAALLMGFIFETNGNETIFSLNDNLRGAVLYFIVAICAGIAITFSLTRKEFTEILPGIAVAIALVPPLSLIGIGLSDFAIDMIRSNLFIFFFNLLGILVGSSLVFSLLKFQKVEKKVEETAEEQEKEAEKEKEE